MSQRNQSRRVAIVVALFLVLAIIALAVGVGIAMSSRHDSQTPSPSVSAVIVDPGDEAAGGPTDAPVSIIPGVTIAPTSARLPGEPDPALTPGALNPAVTQANIGSTICQSGWTATIRPGVDYTNNLKRQQMAQYGYTDTAMADYEEDHLVSLELGGNPTDPRNLWPEPYKATLADGRPAGAHVKDAFETALKREVCAGTVSLSTAQGEIGDHWVHFYYGIPLGTATTQNGAVPTTATAGPSGTVSVSFSAAPKSVTAGDEATFAVTTAPGAQCSISVVYASGARSTAVGLTPETAGAGGAASWTWRVGASTAAGTAAVSVVCEAAGSSGSAQTTFDVG